MNKRLAVLLLVCASMSLQLRGGLKTWWRARKLADLEAKVAKADHLERKKLQGYSYEADKLCAKLRKDVQCKELCDRCEQCSQRLSGELAQLYLEDEDICS